MKGFMIKVIALSVMFILGCSTTQAPPPETKPTGPVVEPNALYITSHKLMIELDPARHLLKGTDTFTVTNAPMNDVPDGNKPLYFALHPQLNLKSLSLVGFDNSIPIKFSKGKIDGLQIYTFNFPPQLPKGAPGMALRCQYEGTIYDPVEEEKALGFVRGGLTSGIISDKGVYIHHGTGWYPRTHLNNMMTFDVTSVTPPGWEVVGQNELKEYSKDKNGKTSTRWTSDIQTDSYTLVAGQYIITAETHNGIRVATYFSQDSQPLAQVHIDAAKEFLTLFSQVLTPYPYKSFSIVENFFMSGYGMPSYTLLGKDVIMRRHTHEGGLGHEIMHSWWGNFVYVDEDKGNWCEGLTSYCSNYYYLELKKTSQDAFDYRRNNCVKFSAFVNADNDRPVREFKGKQVEVDNEIGYGKPMAVFHMMRRLIGDKPFFEALRLVIKEKGGQKASWDDFQAAFEKTASKQPGEFKWFFTQWLDKTDAPNLSLENVRLNNTQISFVVRQPKDKLFKLLLPLVINREGAQDSYDMEIQAAETNSITIGSATQPISIVFDPEYHIFRRFTPKEMLPCLGMTLGDTELLVVYPSGGTPDETKIYESISQRVSQTQKATVKADKDVSQDDLTKYSILLLGSPAINSLTAKLADSLRTPHSELRTDSFSLASFDYKEPKYAVMLSARNPLNENKYITLFMGLSGAAVERPARIIFFYRWDQYLLFEDGKMVKKGMFGQPANALEYKFVVQTSEIESTPAPLGQVGINGERMLEHCKYLASAELKGRAPGTGDDAKAAEYIAAQFKEYGLSPRIVPFSIPIQKLDKDNSLTLDGKALALGKDFLPVNFSRNGDIKDLPVIFAGYGIKAPEYQYNDYKDIEPAGKVVLIKLGLPDTIPATATKYTAEYKMVHALQVGAKAVLFTNKDLDNTDVVWEEFPSAAIQKRLASDEPKTRNVTLRSLTLGGQSRIQPVMMRLPTLLTTLAPESIKPDSKVSLQVAITQEEAYQTQNVLVGLRGDDPALKDEMVVIGAHYDHLGVGQDGKPFVGANDNASGTAGLLAIAQAFANQPQKPKRSIIFIAFGGEELGLWGSKTAVMGLRVSQSKPVAMLNMDMIGKQPMRSNGDLYVMGPLFNPELYEVVKKLNPGLTIMTNIDFVFKYGSDHYSFHQAKIPALNFSTGPFEEEHTVGDTPDKLVPEKMEQVAKLVYAVASEIANSDIKFAEPKDIEVPFPKGGMGGGGGKHPGRQQPGGPK